MSRRDPAGQVPTGAGPTAAAAPGPGSAWTAELAYHGAAPDEVLAAGIADRRLEPEILEAAIRAAIAAWLTAAEEASAPGHPAATRATTSPPSPAAAPPPPAAAAPAVAAELLRPGGPGARTRLVLRSPRIDSIGVMGLRAAPGPAAARLLVLVRGGRCIQDRDTGAPVSGDLAVMTWFHQFWDLVRDGPPDRPWRLAPRAGPHGRDDADRPESSFTAGQETARQYQDRTGASGPPPAPPGPVRRFRISCGFFEHDVRAGGSAEITARLPAAPAWNDAVQLVLPAVLASLTRSTGLSAWRPTISGLDVRELLG
jgi:hypothetical protein